MAMALPFPKSDNAAKLNAPALDWLERDISDDRLWSRTTCASVQPEFRCEFEDVDVVGLPPRLVLVRPGGEFLPPEEDDEDDLSAVDELEPSDWSSSWSQSSGGIRCRTVGRCGPPCPSSEARLAIESRLSRLPREMLPSSCPPAGMGSMGKWECNDCW